MDIVALRKRLYERGSTLARDLVRSYYGPECSLVLKALILLLENQSRVLQHTISEYLHLNDGFVGKILQRLSKDLIVSGETVVKKIPLIRYYNADGAHDDTIKDDIDSTQISQIQNTIVRDYEKYKLYMNKAQSLKDDPTVRITESKDSATTKIFYPDGRSITISESKKQIEFVYWTIKYENLVYIIKYKHQHILASLNVTATSSTYKCTNLGCYEYDKQYDQTDVIERNVSLHASNIFKNGPSVGIKSDQSIAKLNRNQLAIRQNKTQFSYQVGGKRSGIGNHNTLSQLQSAVKLGSDVITPDTANTLTTTTRLTDGYVCHACHAKLQHLSAYSSDQIKILFNQYITPLSTLSTEVFQILKDIRELELTEVQNVPSDTGTSGQSKAPGGHSGASTSADLMSRVEIFKEDLAWQEGSKADTRRAQEEREKALLLQAKLDQEEEARREEEEREKRAHAIYQEQQDAKRQIEMRDKIFGSIASSIQSNNTNISSSLPTMASDTTTLTTTTTQSSSLLDPYHGDIKSEYTATAYHNDMPQEQYNDEPMFDINGVSYPISALTQDMLNLLSDDDMQRYEDYYQ